MGWLDRYNNLLEFWVLLSFGEQVIVIGMLLLCVILFVVAMVMVKNRLKKSYEDNQAQKSKVFEAKNKGGEST